MASEEDHTLLNRLMAVRGPSVTAATLTASLAGQQRKAAVDALTKVRDFTHMLLPRHAPTFKQYVPSH
jgi:hypothetical protein